MSRSILAPSTMKRVCRAAFVAAMLNLAPAAALAQDGGSFTGDHVDPVTGFPCVNQFCDVVRLPGTDCLCSKQNPSEKVLARLRLSCTASGGQSQTCPATGRLGN